MTSCLKQRFLLGVTIILPFGLTFFILAWCFVTINDMIVSVMGLFIDHPSKLMVVLSIVTFVVLIFVVGTIANNIIVRLFRSKLNYLIYKLPLIREIYSTIYQVVSGFVGHDESAKFLKVVMIEFPRKGIWTPGFVTKEVTIIQHEPNSYEYPQHMYVIFIPTSPNPVSGFVQICSRTEFRECNLSVTEALKIHVSMGKVAPDKFSEY